MPLVTVEQLRERLGWNDIREKRMPDYEMCWFSVVPDDESLPSVDFLFDDKVEFLVQVGSGEWHYHPDEIDDAIDLVLNLIYHETCILEERNKKGECSGSGVVAANEVMHTLRLDADHFIRRFFGQQPVREAIDFSRYFKGKHIYIDLKHKADSDAMWTSLGMPPPEF